MYSVLEEQLVTYDGEEYTAYGVQCLDYSYAISDISLNKDKIVAFVNMINSNDLHSVHLLDVVEDFLNELQ